MIRSTFQETIFRVLTAMRSPLANQNPESPGCKSAKLVQGAQVPRKEIQYV